MRTGPDNPRQADARRHAVAVAHGDAAPRTKRYAAMMGVTARTARRHRSPDASKGSPLYRHFEYLECVDDPYRIAAATMTHARRMTMKQWTTEELIERIHELHALDALGEGEDNATRARKGVSLLDRATATERDAAHDLELAACYREADARGLSERDVFGR